MTTANGLKLSETITIRKATINDLETLLQFEQGVISAERPFDPTLRPHPNYYYDIKQMIDDATVELVVAEANGQLVGCGYARIEKSKPYLRHDKHAYLGFMYVDPAWRGKNVNQMIVEKLKEWSIAQGLSEMRLEVYCDNHAAIKAYEKAGFSKLLIEMRMGLASD
jgi:ribosomal protein S18 acetylase RimI-like enzyme